MNLLSFCRLAFAFDCFFCAGRSSLFFRFLSVSAFFSGCFFSTGAFLPLLRSKFTLHKVNKSLVIFGRKRTHMIGNIDPDLFKFDSEGSCSSCCTLFGLIHIPLFFSKDHLQLANLLIMFSAICPFFTAKHMVFKSCLLRHLLGDTAPHRERDDDGSSD